MSKIICKEVFDFNGKNYDSLEKAQQAEYDHIANYIDKEIFSAACLTAGDKIKFIDKIMENRIALSFLLSMD